MAIIECNKLQLGYGQQVLISDLNFCVNEKDYLLIVGENGCGKTTLMKSLLGLIPYLSGELVFNKKIQRIGYLPQKVEIVDDFPATVQEVVLSGRLNHKKWKFFYTREDREIAKQNIEKMGISHLTRTSFQTLSLGQKQKVLLARALCASRQILLLDEPCASLDYESRLQFYDLVDELNKEMTIIMITHDLNQAIHRATHILELKENSFYGTSADYIKVKEGNHV
ncbi:MAG: ATP-binding cassette domain-containing protein [Erysipelotrichaceae bacterium]